MKTILVALAICVYAGAIGQMINANQSARDFALKCGKNPEVLQEKRSENRRTIDFEGTDFVITYDTQSNKVTSWYCTPQSRDSGNEKIPDEEEMWTIAEEWARKVEFPMLQRHKLTMKKLGDKVDCGIALFKNRPYGYNALVGNVITIEIDANSREVVRAHQGVEFSYDKPVVDISKDEAEKIFLNKIRKVYGCEADKIQVIDTAYASNEKNDETFVDDDVEDYAAKRRSRLAYVIEGIVRDKGISVCMRIDVQTGFVLGGGEGKGLVGREKTKFGTARKQEGEQPSNNTSSQGKWQIRVLIGMLIAIVSLALAFVIRFIARKSK